MVFSSFVFLFVFLPIVLLVYYVCPKKARNVVLLLASLLFYAWGEPRYVVIMLFSTVFDYTNGRLIEYFKNHNRLGKAKAVLIIDICGNLGILGFFKYTDFVLSSINSVTSAGIHLLGIALPIGISFYTFQTMSYTIDVYRGVVPAQKNILNFGTYVCLFPQLIAGPIVQYKTIGEELEDRKVGWKDFSEGAFRFTVGLAKKVILANQIGNLFDTIQATQNLSTAAAWLGAIAFTFQIYFDFSGYSDMAIGLGRIFGFHFLENFDHPYMSRSITEFWRRWHISLGSWFREYVYIPLGGNRKGMARQLINLFVVWALTGLWHGASWNFVLWGIYYGVLLMLEKLFLLKWMKKWPRPLQHIYSLVLVVIGWVLFSITEMPALGGYLEAMIGIGVPLYTPDVLFYLQNNGILLLLLVLCSLDYKEIFANAKWILDLKNKKAGQICAGLSMVLLFLLSVASLVGSSYNPFLYFRF